MVMVMAMMTAVMMRMVLEMTWEETITDAPLPIFVADSCSSSWNWFLASLTAPAQMVLKSTTISINDWLAHWLYRPNWPRSESLTKLPKLPKPTKTHWLNCTVRNNSHSLHNLFHTMKTFFAQLGQFRNSCDVLGLSINCNVWFTI